MGIPVHISLAICVSRVGTLSSAEASLYCGEAFVLWGGWGERKRERAAGASAEERAGGDTISKGVPPSRPWSN